MPILCLYYCPFITMAAEKRPPLIYGLPFSIHTIAGRCLQGQLFFETITCPDSSEPSRRQIWHASRMWQKHTFLGTRPDLSALDDLILVRIFQR